MPNFTDTAGNDILNGSNQADTFTMRNGGDDGIEGYAGNDRVIFDARNLGGAILMSIVGQANGGLYGSASWTGAHINFFTVEHFTFFTDDGNFADNVTTGFGDDVFHHSALNSAGYAQDIVNLAGGDDLIVAAFSGVNFGAVSISLSAPDANGHNGNVNVGGISKIAFTGVNRFQITGSQLADTIQGGIGADVLAGGGAGDTLLGGDGGDQLDGQAGDDILNGEGGDDRLDGQEGDDSLIGGAGNDVLTSSSGSDTVDGGVDADRLIAVFGAGNVTMAAPTPDGQIVEAGGRTVTYSAVEQFTITTGNGTDNINTGGGSDVLDLGSGDDSANGGGGDDVIDGGGGDDSMAGGAGNDVFIVDSLLDSVIELAGGGTDEIRTSFTNYSIAAIANVENLTRLSTLGGRLTGNGLDNVLQGGDGSDTLTGLGGNDTLRGGQGSDSYLVEDVGDLVLETANQGNDTVYTTVSYTLAPGSSVEILLPYDRDAVLGLTLTGNELTNTIYGDQGANLLDSGGGGDTLYGLGGDDTYVTSSNDRLNAMEVAGAGFDRILLTIGGAFFSTFDLVQGSAIEVVEVVDRSSTLTFSIYGNEFDNIIRGNDGNNGLYGNMQFGSSFSAFWAPGGNDSLYGYLGNDSYFVDSPGDLVFEAAGEGTDTVFTVGNYRLTDGAHVEVVQVFSPTSANAINITGNALDNELRGNNGANLLIGNGGTDTLIGSNGNDSYIVDDESDIVIEGTLHGFDTVYTTASYTLRPGVQVEVLTPYERELTDAINLTGNERDNLIYGNAGSNTLIGGGGADSFYGLEGDDRYLVDGLSDQVFEQASHGYDTVYSINDFELNNSSYVEALTVYDRDTTNALTLFGNNLDNVIYGNQGSNALLGGGGEDTFYGLGGDDRYFVDSLGDHVIEVAGGGNDTVYTTLGSYQLITDQSVETLTVYDRDTSYAANLIGNNLAQLIYGNAGTNNIDGKGGADTLYGMAGTDTFTFTAAPIAGQADTLADFSAADDTIALDDVAFLGIGATGALNANAFVTGSSATTDQHRIVYNQATGQLFFDADGNGTGAAIHFATVNAGTVLSASDFVVI